LPTIRCARPDEYEPLMRFLDAAYDDPPGWFATFCPNDWLRETTDWEHCYVIDDDEGIASLVRVWRLEMALDGRALAVGGIGSVATDPRARGRGYMTLLMQHACERMRAEGMPVSILWGNAHRYRPFGYWAAGRSAWLQVAERGLCRAGVEPLEGAAVPSSAMLAGGGDAVLARLAQANGATPYRRARRPSEWRTLYGRKDLETLWADPDGCFGALTLHRHEDGRVDLAEAVGDMTTCLRLAAGVAREVKGARFSFGFPADVDPPAALWEASDGLHTGAAGMVAVLDLDAALAALGLQQHRRSFEGLGPGETVRHLFGAVRPGLANLWVPAIDHI
jgi:predicted N-acetyltransferase YhbS